MNSIQILDCTLRDGGYVNKWKFGKGSIPNILQKLTSAQIDWIECGFLKNQFYDKDTTLFSSIEQAEEWIPEDRRNSQYVLMINYGEYPIEQLPKYCGGAIKGLRITFHKKNMEQALDYCKAVCEKGYQVFVQPMVTIKYNDYELIELITSVNEMKPYALYIVDSFGVMRKKDLLRMYYLIDHNLSAEIKLGYHSHNNMQLAFSNAQALSELNTRRALIIDTTILGMGRGAGNLNTELFVEYCNDNNEKKYPITPLLEAIDEEINRIYSRHYWGYSLPHYLSACHNCHPNYATYLAEKNTLNIESIHNILCQLTDEKKEVFYKEYIEQLYMNYQGQIYDDTEMVTLFKSLNDRNILIMAPGKSIKQYENEIKSYREQHRSILVAINFMPHIINCHYLFFNNERRYKHYLKEQNKEQNVILSSNLIETKNENLVKGINYQSIKNEDEKIVDNGTLMFINFLIRCGYKKVAIAGFDGYRVDEATNYVEPEMAQGTSSQILLERNEAISSQLKKLVSQIQLDFITPTIYEYK